MRKLVLTMGITLMMVLSFSNVGLAQTIINTKESQKGIVTVMSTDALSVKTKVRIVKGEEMVTYDLLEANKEIPFALTFGNGTYKVQVFENVNGFKGNQYSMVSEKRGISLNLDNTNEVFLQKTNEINWSEEQEYIKLASELTQGLTTDEEKITAIYNYLTQNFTYDFSKIYRVDYTYKPDITKLFEEKKGICYDYSAIFAGMLRSLNIPTKLVKGYQKADLNTYHAWNQVFLNGEWKTLDLTNDAYRIQHNIQTDMYKDASLFNVSNVY